MDQETKQILLRVKEKNPSLFKKKKVLEIGSLNLDQIEDFSIRSLFEDCRYTGVDINAGKDVDVVGHFGDVVSSLSGPYDFILCLNCLEHDIRWRETTIKALSLLKKGGHALFHTPSMLSDLHVVEHCKVNNVFKSREGSPDPYDPELYFKDVFFLKNKPGSQVETSETYKSQSGAFGD